MSKLRALSENRPLISPGPIDERALDLGITIPLLIAPGEPYKKIYSRRRNGHHGAGFPTDHPELQLGTQARRHPDDSRVIRWSRVQEELKVLHDKYHGHFDHVPLPQNEHEQFLAVLLNSAGYIPPCGVDVRGDRPQIVTYDQAQLNHLRRPGTIHQQAGMRWRIGFYFGRYIVKHGLEAVRDSIEVSQFIEADKNHKIRLGYNVIRLAAEAVVQPVEPIYQNARREGLISPEQPNYALRFMMKHFEQRQPDYFQTLEQELVA